MAIYKPPGISARGVVSHKNIILGSRNLLFFRPWLPVAAIRKYPVHMSVSLEHSICCRACMHTSGICQESSPVQAKKQHRLQSSDVPDTTYIVSFDTPTTKVMGFLFQPPLRAVRKSTASFRLTWCPQALRLTAGCPCAPRCPNTKVFMPTRRALT